MSATWEALADAHLSPRNRPSGGRARGAAFALVPQNRGKEDARLRSAAGYCPAFVRPFASKPLYAATWKTPMRRVGVTLSARTEEGAAYARAELAPLLEAVVDMLEAAGVGRKPTVDVAYVPCPQLRSTPRAKGASIGSVHVNGGVTTVADGRILVFRREDAPKVMVHELLHLYGLDGALFAPSAAVRGAESALATRHRVRTNDMRLAEAYVDLMACYLHAVWRGRAGPRDMAETVGRHLDAVAWRVLRVLRDSREETHAFAYYVCKAALWPHLPRVLAAFPPGHPPSDPAAFAAMTDVALRMWLPRAPPSAPGASLRMTAFE